MSGDIAIRSTEQEQQAVACDANELMQPDRQPEPDQTRSTVMLFEVLKICAIHLHVKARRRSIRACAAVMDRLRIGKENNAPPAVVETLGPIEILAVHEKLRVEVTDFVDSLLANHPEPTGQNIHVNGPVVFEIGHREVAKSLRMAKDGTERKGVAEPAPESREPITGLANGAVTQNHFRPQHSDIPMLLHVLHHGFQAAIGNHYVGIDEGDKFSRAVFKALIICSSKANIFLVRENFSLGELFPNTLHGVIRRCIVDEYYFDGSRQVALRKGIQTIQD